MNEYKRIDINKKMNIYEENEYEVNIYIYK